MSEYRIIVRCNKSLNDKQSIIKVTHSPDRTYNNGRTVDVDLYIKRIDGGLISGVMLVMTPLELFAMADELVTAATECAATEQGVSPDSIDMQVYSVDILTSDHSQ